MGNKVRGYLDFPCGDRNYRLAFSTNALCEWEEYTGLTMTSLSTAMANPSIQMMRTLVWAGLRDNHPEISLADAGKIMDEVGIPETGALIMKAFEMAFPNDEEEKAAGKTNGRPPRLKGKETTIGTG